MSGHNYEHSKPVPQIDLSARLRSRYVCRECEEDEHLQCIDPEDCQCQCNEKDSDDESETGDD